MSSSRRFFVIPVCVTAGIFAIGLQHLHSAGTNAAEEAAIRKLISAGHMAEESYLPDAVVWTGAMKRPTVGSEKPEEISSPNAPSNRVQGSQKITIQPIRIVVADGRDLAYEYSKSNLQFDLKNGEHINVDTGVLRVWQKQDGKWKIAATFTHPFVS